MAKSENSKKKSLESLGWGMWVICFLIFYGPFFYVSWIITVESMRKGILPWLLAFIMSALLAGILTTISNTILQRRIEATLKEERRADKKKKKKK